MFRRNKMADVEEAPLFPVSFTMLMLFSRDFKWIRVKMQAINHGLFQCSNIRWITRKVFEHAACGLVFKHLPRDPSNV